jgi:hypothetical protein
MECSICLTKCINNCYTVLDCKHIYHTHCILQNIMIGVQKNSCPLCRDDINENLMDVIFKNSMDENEIITLLKNKNDVLKEKLEKNQSISLIIFFLYLHSSFRKNL